MIRYTTPWPLWAACILLSALLLGCSSTTQTVDDNAWEASSLKVETAHADAALNSASVERFRTSLRYNPAPCACPPWELRLEGVWTRAALRASRDAGEDVEMILAEDALVSGARLRGLVQRSNRTELGEDGWRYRVFELIEATSGD